MPTPNPFPLNIPEKVNSPELLAYFQQFGIETYLSAEEINKIDVALRYLYENIGGGSLNQTYVITQGTTTIVDDEVTFGIGFSWQINGVVYSNASDVVEILPLATAGNYRTHVAYLDMTTIKIEVGDEDTEVTQEPTIPAGTLRLRSFNIFGDTITGTIGPELPFNISGLDEWMANPEAGNKMLINIAGVPYKIDFQKLIDVLSGGGSSNTIVAVGTITKSGLEFTFSTGFSWLISGVTYANASAVARTIVAASAGYYRIDVAYANASNTILIQQGAEAADVAVKPVIPADCVEICTFNIFGGIVSIGGGLQDLQSVLNVGKLSTFTGEDGQDIFINIGDEVFNVFISQEISDFYYESASLFSLNGISLSISKSNLISGDSIYSYLEIIDGNIILRKQNQYFSEKTANQKIEFEDIAEIDISGTELDVVYKPNPKTVSGTYYLATLDDINDAIEGLKTKQPVRLATTANITLSGLAMIDGETPADGERILVKDQTDGWLNGIYIAASGAWERAIDANTSTELINAVVSVLEGAANGQSTYRQINTSLVLESGLVIWQSFGSSVPDATSSTKGKMKLFSDLLNSFTDGSVTQAAIVAALNSKANLQNIEKYIFSKNNGTFGTHTGDLLETVIRVDTISGGEFVAGDWLTLLYDLEKDGNSNVTYRIRAGINGDLSDNLIVMATGESTTSRTVGMERVRCQFLTGNLLRMGSPSLGSLVSDIVGSSFPVQISLNPASDWKLTITAQLTTLTETALLKGFRIGKIKSF